MDAVTTYWREWRWAAMAPARSIQCMRRPPRSAFSGLASLGSTISVISEIDSRTGRGVNFALSPSFIDCQLVARSLNWSFIIVRQQQRSAGSDMSGDSRLRVSAHADLDAR